MPQIYEVINLYNQEKGLFPYRYIGSDQNDNANYFGSSAELKNDIKRIGKEFFIKKTLKFFDNIDNQTLRKIESDILKENRVKDSLMFYNKNENYSPGCGVKGMKHKNKKIVSERWKESRKGWKPSSETRNLWKEQRKNRHASNETKEKMSKSNARYFLNVIGEDHPVTGYRHSEYEKQKRSERMKERMKDQTLRQELSNRMSRNWMVTDPSGKIFKIKNLSKWCKQVEVSYSTVRNHRKGWKCQIV
jgi:hypothetical protein